MSTDQLLHNALSDMADAADELPGGGDHIRKLADEKYPHEFEPTPPRLSDPILDNLCALCDRPNTAPHTPHVHDFKRVPDSERNDTLRFCATMFRCEECGESYTC